MIYTGPSVQLLVAVGESDHSLGPKSAPVTLVEYGDFECPHCRQAYPVVKELQRQFDRKLRFVFRNFPVTSYHSHAEHAAKAAEAIASHGKFWEIHDLLFQNQDALDIPNLVHYAVALGLDRSSFISELRGQVHADRILEDFLGGVRSGVSSTPTFFINGWRHDGSLDFNTLMWAIENQIAASTGTREGQFSQPANLNMDS